MDEFKGLREKVEEAGRKAAAEEAWDVFQVVVHGKKNKRPSGKDGGTGGSDAVLGAGPARMTTKDKAAAAPRTKAEATLHDPRHPAAAGCVLNQSDMPFDHVWLERSEDGTRPIHPLEKLPVEQFIDRIIPESEPEKPADVDDTPFTLVEDQKDLVELAKKLKSVNEFAVRICN